MSLPRTDATFAYMPDPRLVEVRRLRRRFILALAIGIAMGLLIGTLVTKAMANAAHYSAIHSCGAC
ncbi:hypothetical protein [Vannielia litorea]|uniref:hypothetical protein n=1 Tax=Vannielia litorea TaxID=1217970 RepID=UPI001BD0D83A|nr:hypothetical protein [Vannielia litorea]MBS8227131.1 hypothetical protein [Vannielia litorea]